MEGLQLGQLVKPLHILFGDRKEPAAHPVHNGHIPLPLLAGQGPRHLEVVGVQPHLVKKADAAHMVDMPVGADDSQRLFRDAADEGRDVEGPGAGVNQQGLVGPFQQEHRVHPVLVDAPGALRDHRHNRGLNLHKNIILSCQKMDMSLHTSIPEPAGFCKRETFQ